VDSTWKCNELTVCRISPQRGEMFIARQSRS
jgi:hypothetical protein